MDVVSPELIKRGEYLATAGDCVACHTAPGGKPFAGGLAIETPIGDIVATNITPSKSAGIGNYTLEQFSAALRQGVRADGRYLYPAMPYTAYAKVNDDDIAAIYAYFMHAVAPVDAAPPPTRLPFPFDFRLSLAAWNLLFLDRNVFRVDPSKDAEWNRGAYLARGLAHCGTCHTPRNLLMAESRSRELGGGALGTWFAPNITSDADSGIGGWSEGDLVDYLREGRAAGRAQAAGPMAEAVDHSLRHLSDTDLRAIAVYLKTVPAVHDPADSRASFAWGAPVNNVAAIRGVPWPQDPERLTGAQLYDANCATCHQVSGQGSFDGRLPPLFHNSALGRAQTNNLVMVVLAGIQRQGQGTEVVMPGFAQQMSDSQIATLCTYLIDLYGDPSAKVDAEEVRTVRAGGPASHLVLLARLGLTTALVLLVLVFLVVLHRRRPRVA